MISRLWLTAFLLAAYAVVGSQAVSFIPEGYSWVGRTSRTNSSAETFSRQQAPPSALTPFHSTGYVAHIDLADLKKSPHNQQRSVDQDHETLLSTWDGHLYTKPLRLPDSAKHQNSQLLGQQIITAETQLQPADRHLLQVTTGAGLNPTLACEGCPSTDTRVRVNDTTKYPWTAVGMVTRDQQSAISGEVVQCSGTLIGQSHVLTAGHCVVNTDSGETISGMQYWPAFNGNDEPFDPITVSATRVLSRFANQTTVSTSSLNYDFALLTLRNAAPAGTANLAIVGGVGEQTYDLTTAGYPGDKAQGTMWTTNCTHVQFDFEGTSLEDCGGDCDNMVQHSCLTYEGQSGSGMWSENNQTIHSIVTGAVTLSDGTNLNVGIQLNSFVYNTIVGWYNEDATEPLALTPAPPSAPASHHGYNEGGSNSASWFSNHIWVTVVPAVVAAIIGLALLCCLITCLRRCCRRRRAPPVVGPQARVPPPYPVGPHGSYASQYAQHAQHPQNNFARPPPNASAFAQSFYSNGDPTAQQGYGRRAAY